ncbi:MAG TPA: type IV pilus secretin PilQ [Pyrinomonadaceae bacterium]|jgi:type IV pilus assembly protein PilQ
MPALHHLYATTRRVTLVLLIVCSLSLVALAAGNSAPVATNVSATTSGAQTLITISGTAPMAYSVKRPDAHTIVVELPGVDASRLSSTYAVTSQLVEKVTVEREMNGSEQLSPRLRVDLRASARDRSQMVDNNLVLELSPEDATDGDAKAKAAQPVPTPRPGMSSASNSTPQSAQGQQYGSPGFVGEPINLNVVNADIRDILNYITEQYGVNFVIDSSVGAVPVTVNVTDVPWNIALDAILRANRLGIDVNGNILRVATNEVLATETSTQQKIREAQLDNSPLYTEFIRLNYARASGTLATAAGSTGGFAGGTVGTGGNQSFSGGSGGDASGGGGDAGILPIIARRLSRRGSVEVDGRSNTLIITDVKENIEAVRQLVLLLDQPEPQVEIETRIVIANRNFSRDLGVQLAATILNTSRSNPPGFAFGTLPNLVNNTAGPQPGVPGGLPGTIKPTSGLGANLPTTVIGLTTGLIGTAQISAAITAAETKGQAKVIASPRVTALNNRPAQIESGQQIPVVTPQTGAGGSGGALVFTTTFVSVPLRLSITPQITDVGTVVLRVVAENNSVNTAIAVAGTPGIDTQRMQTEVLVPDGGTTVIGGVLADNESELQTRTPGLGSIPVLGNLFKRKSTTRQTNEILFFITPRIYRPDYQGNPTSGTVSNGTRSTTILQPVPLGNPPSNSQSPFGQQQQQQQQQQAIPPPAGNQGGGQQPESRP